MSKRGENIYKRKDGRWEARYPKGHSCEGHILYGSVYGQTYNEAKKKRAQVLIDTSISDRFSFKGIGFEMTLCDLAREWLGQKHETIKESTYVRYRYLYEKHIDDRFGRVPLKKLDCTKIETYIRTKQKTNVADGLAPKTIQDILSVCRLLICFGIEKGYLPSGYTLNKINPSKDIKQIENKINVFLPKERICLEKFALNGGTVRLFGIVLALYTGIRIGELCALRWNDIDLENGIMYVRNTIQRLKDYSNIGRGKTKLIIGPPKTVSSARIIPLSSFLVDKLKWYTTSSKFFFLTGKDTPEEPRSYLYFYKKQLEMCGLPEYTFHTIRHTFATRCIEEGIDVKSLSEILGHSNVKITMNRYVHPSLEMKRQQLEKLCTPS